MKLKYTGPVLLFAFLFCGSLSAMAQKSYKDSLHTFLANYVAKHEVVKGKDKEYLQFFEVQPPYRVTAKFEKIDDAPWFLMDASGPMKRMHRIYGKLHFKIRDTAVRLNVYQSQALLQSPEYRDYLFLPFTDATSGIESYEGGRYLDLMTGDIHGDSLVLDFNKAYNPYCAYVSKVYSCPLPPKENHLTVAINAGEKMFQKKH